MRGANAYEPLNQTREQLAAQEPGADQQADIDRALALEPEGQPAPEQTHKSPSLDDPVAPEQWTDRGGMVEQQASAMEWLEHSDEVRRERAGQEYEAAAHELTNEDQELLDAARATEAQTQQQEMAQSQVHEPSGP
jgi:hypothetical protein